MTAGSLHALTVPALLRLLDRLSHLLDIAEAHAAATGVDVLSARLAPDMLPFETQAQVVVNFALRTGFPLAGRPVPDYGRFEPTVEGLRARLGRAAALLRELPPEAFDLDLDDGRPGRLVEDRAGDATVRLPPAAFLTQYALPNLVFHLTIAYALLRQLGAPVGKADFDGFHVYARPPA